MSQDQYDKALFQARRSIVSDSDLRLPWETGVFASIFSDQSVDVPGPVNTFLQPSFASDFQQFQTIVSSRVDPRMQLKRTMDDSIHTQVLSTLRDVDAKQIESDLWETAISKWQMIFQLVGHPGPNGERLKMASLEQDPKTLERAIIRDVLGVKSPRTASKRADSLRKFFNWCQTKKCAIWPIYANRVLTYLSGDFGNTPASTTGLALLEAFRFCKHVMGIDVGEDVLGDPQLKGRINLLLVEKSNYTPARPLLCSEVAMMERFVCNGEDLADVYLVGCCLFAIFSRCRWSDLRFLDKLVSNHQMRFLVFWRAPQPFTRLAPMPIASSDICPLLCPC